jgi:hypothetical protein
MLLRTHHPKRQIRSGLPGFAALGILGGIAPLFGYEAFSLGFVAYV